LHASQVPFDWYKAFVVAGALEHGLPDAYIRALQDVVATRDPNDERREAALAVLGARSARRASPRSPSR